MDVSTVEIENTCERELSTIYSDSFHQIFEIKEKQRSDEAFTNKK